MVRHDQEKKILLAYLQSPAGIALQRHFGIHDTQMDTMLLIRHDSISDKSTAWLHIMTLLGWPWRAAMVFFLVPRFLRDSVYSFIGKRRYRWFGRSETCRIPDAGVADRFLSLESAQLLIRNSERNGS